MKKERPIIFSDPMVRALLDGIKTQTRRLVNPQPVGHTFKWEWEIKRRLSDRHRPNDDSSTPCPYGRLGDRLWVREAWSRESWPSGVTTEYRASWGKAGDRLRWKEAIHMPRDLCRIVLEITDVRVERLHAITEADALAEGMASMMRGCTRSADEARGWFQYLWNSIHPGIGSWRDNPWVWVLSIRRIESD
jgi:hypothetical protein